MKHLMLDCETKAGEILAGVKAAWSGCLDARMGGTSPSVPDYYTQTSDTLKAQVAEAPALYGANANFQPLYTGLNLSNIQQLLQGTQNPWGVTTTPGLVSDYSNLIAPTIAQGTAAAQTIQSQNELNNLATLGPQYNAAIRAGSPQAASLLDQLNSQANTELQAGTALTADQQRQLNNEVNASQAARGMAYGPAASYANALATTTAGSTMQQQRQGFAQGVLGANNQFYTDPLLGIVTGSPTSTGTGSNILGMSSSLLPGSQFNPQAGQSVYNTQAQIGSANAASQNAMTGQLIGGGLSGLGSLAMLAGGAGAGAAAAGSGVTTAGLLGSLGAGLFALL